MATPMTQTSMLQTARATAERASKRRVRSVPGSPAWIYSSAALARRTSNRITSNRACVILGWSARGYWHLARAFADGFRDDYPQMIRTARADLKTAKGSMAKEAQARAVLERRRQEYRQHRKGYLLKAGLVSAAGATAGGYGIAEGGMWTALVMGLAAVAYGAWRGRPAATDPGAVQLGTGDDDPFPIADARNRTEASECVRRALASEGITVSAVEANRRHAWGWEVTVRMAKGKPADIIAKAPDLETPLDLPEDGLLCQPMRTSRGSVVLRLVQGDPFHNMPQLPEYAPNSLRLKDRVLLARRMDGVDFKASVLGVHFLVIASSGGGKSVTLRTIGDALTACSDVVVVDLDPGGNGLEPLADAIGVRVVGGDKMHLIEAVLEKLLAIAKARPLLFSKLGMGDNWEPSPEFPAVVALIDEYPQLSARAKELVVAILRVGRKSRVLVGLAAQEATKDSLGAAIADSIALRIVGPSRHQDVVQVFGAGAGANGWRPDRLHPAQGEDVADAGKAYIMGAGSGDPMIYKFVGLSAGEAKDRAAARKRAGRPWFDALSLETAGVTFDDLDTIRPHGPVAPVIDLARAAFTAAGDPERMTTADIYDYAALTDPGQWKPADDEDVDKARNRYLKALRAAAAESHPDVDMGTEQWRGGRGYYLEKVRRLTGEIGSDGA